MDNKERAELYSENSQYWHGEYQKLSAESSERIAELEAALEMAQQCLRRCGDEWEGLSDSSLPENVQEHHRKIGRWIGKTLQQLEQALKGVE